MAKKLKDGDRLVTIRLPGDMVDRIDAKAATDRRTRTATMELLLWAGLKLAHEQAA